MKKIIFILCVMLLANRCLSQATLEFNQVLWITFSGVWGDTQTITVPANKAWKIESGGISSSNLGCDALYLDNQIIATSTFIGSSTDSYGTKTPANGFPIWLPAGSYDLMIGHLSGLQGLCYSFISVIEYNVQ
ncbi:MAG TPA: hypothetical protein VE978_07195 [Chitinophagales bacterium]|nr:hypothetical protein [Chitinophagales bacterium]